jgi:hypothetical protein
MAKSYPSNARYPAAWDREIRHALFTRKICDRDRPGYVDRWQIVTYQAPVAVVGDVGVALT